MNSSHSLYRFTFLHTLILLLLAILGVATSPINARAQAAPSADIFVSKSGAETAALGSQITYTLAVFNAGPDDAVNIVLTDELPAHTSFVSASTADGSVSFDGTTLTWNVGTLAFNATAIASFVVQVDQDAPRGTISNTVTGTSDTPDPDPSNNSATAFTTVIGPFAGDVLISEFRLRGPEGANDEYVELYNNTDTPIAVSTTDESGGWALAASDGVVRFVIPNGTVIPARGHFLGVNSGGYSLSSYPSGNNGSEPTTATGDATFTIDIPDNAGIAIFRTSNTGNFSTGTRLDAAGSTSEANSLYKEGTGYPAVTEAASLDHAFVRDTCGKGGSTTTFGTCPTGGLPKDTNDNAADFYFVDTNGTSSEAGQRLGAPGPENLTSPIQQNANMPVLLLDRTVSSSSIPNRARDLTSDPANNSTFGTLDIRRRVFNATGFPVTRLRFRIVDISTFAVPSGIADLRARTSTDVTVNNVNDVDTCNGDAPCSVTVLGTTLEQPPGQPNGGGFNSSLSSDTITLATPLALGESINVHFLLGVQQTGSFKFYVNIEVVTDQSNGEGVIPETPQAPGKRLRGTFVKSGIAQPTPAMQPAPAPQPTIQNSATPTILRSPTPVRPVIETERPKSRLLLKKIIDQM